MDVVAVLDPPLDVSALTTNIALDAFGILSYRLHFILKAFGVTLSLAKKPNSSM